MIIFKNSDLHAAAHYLTESTSKFQVNKITNILVQESCYDEFVGILKTKLRSFPNEFTSNKEFLSSFNNVYSTLEKLGAKTISSDLEKSTVKSTIACDLSLEHFDEKHTFLIPTLTAFRTSKEVLNLSKPLSSLSSFCSIWCNGISEGFEIIVNSAFQKYFLNCFNMSLDPVLLRKEETFVVVEKNFFYQKIHVNGLDKFVVFPVGSTFAN